MLSSSLRALLIAYLLPILISFIKKKPQRRARSRKILSTGIFYGVLTMPSNIPCWPRSRSLLRGSQSRTYLKVEPIR
jgi:hypothetical protein